MIDKTVAAVWRGDGEIALEPITVPQLSPGDVLVRVRLATVCGSDRHTVSGRRDQPCPSILGHETVGEIVALSTDDVHDVNGRTLQLDQRVIWSVTLPCGTCDRCQAGVSAKCRTVRKAGHQALHSDWGLSGGYAQHVLLPRGLAIAVVDDDLSDPVAAPAACATATVMAVIERAGELAGRRVVVIGAGMLGLGAIAAAATAGATSVTAVDPSAERRDLASQFGATHVASTVREAGPSDVLLEFSGSSSALQAGVDATRRARRRRSRGRGGRRRARRLRPRTRGTPSTVHPRRAQLRTATSGRGAEVSAPDRRPLPVVGFSGRTSPAR